MERKKKSAGRTTAPVPVNQRQTRSATKNHRDTSSDISSSSKVPSPAKVKSSQACSKNSEQSVTSPREVPDPASTKLHSNSNGSESEIISDSEGGVPRKKGRKQKDDHPTLVKNRKMKQPPLPQTSPIDFTTTSGYPSSTSKVPSPAKVKSGQACDDDSVLRVAAKQKEPDPPSSSDSEVSDSENSSDSEGGAVTEKGNAKNADNPTQRRNRKMKPPQLPQSSPSDSSTTGEPSHTRGNSGQQGDADDSTNEVNDSGSKSIVPSSQQSQPGSSNSSMMESELPSSNNEQGHETGGKDNSKGTLRKRKRLIPNPKPATLRSRERNASLKDADREILRRNNRLAQTRREIKKKLKSLKGVSYDEGVKQYYQEKYDKLENKQKFNNEQLELIQKYAMEDGTDMDQAALKEIQATKAKLNKIKAELLADEEDMLKHGPGISRKSSKRSATNTEATYETSAEETDDEGAPDQDSSSTLRAPPTSISKAPHTSSSTSKAPLTSSSTSKGPLTSSSTSKAPLTSSSTYMAPPRTSSSTPKAPPAIPTPNRFKKVIPATVAYTHAVSSVTSAISVPSTVPSTIFVPDLPEPFTPHARPTTYAGFKGLCTMFERKNVFRGITDKHKEEIFQNSRDVEFNAGEIVQEEGCIFANFIIVIDGALRLLKGDKFVGQLGTFDSYGVFTIDQLITSKVRIITQTYSKLLLVDAMTFGEIIKDTTTSIFPSRGYFLELLHNCCMFDKLTEVSFMNLAKSMKRIVYPKNCSASLPRTAFVIESGFGTISGPAYDKPFTVVPNMLCGDIHSSIRLSYEDKITCTTEMFVGFIPYEMLQKCIHAGEIEDLLASPPNQSCLLEETSGSTAIDSTLPDSNMMHTNQNEEDDLEATVPASEMTEDLDVEEKQEACVPASETSEVMDIEETDEANVPGSGLTDFLDVDENCEATVPGSETSDILDVTEHGLPNECGQLKSNETEASESQHLTPNKLDQEPTAEFLDNTKQLLDSPDKSEEIPQAISDSLSETVSKAAGPEQSNKGQDEPEPPATSSADVVGGLQTPDDEMAKDPSTQDQASGDSTTE